MSPASSDQFAFPDAVRIVVAERVAKLRSGRFPETNIAYASTMAQLLEDMLRKDLVDGYPHRLAADLAIVSSRVAHAQDLDSSGNFVFQSKFRERVWLAEQCNFRSTILDPDTIEKFMAAVQCVRPRALTAQERDQFVQWHKKARHPNPPLLDGEKMVAFLDAQNVYMLPGGTGKLPLCGLSSFDGTCIYIVDEDNGSTIPHELEHNLRRYMEEDAQEQARLVSPAKDPTLRITDSNGDSLQCEAGFVMEKKNGRKVPDDLIGPFSARWNRRFLK